MCKECFTPEKAQRVAAMERNAYRVGAAQTGVVCAGIVGGGLYVLNALMGAIERISF